MDRLKKQLPNVLTILRILLAVLCTYYAYHKDIKSLTISLIIFCVASATDYFDGYFARKWKIVSSFGKLMDPIADKVLILGVLIAFTLQGVIPAILAIVICFREVLLTAIRLLISKNIVLSSRYSGKVKTFSQVIVLIFIYLTLIYRKPISMYIDNSSMSWVIISLVTWLAIISVYSAFDFLYYNRKVMKKELGINI
jgi:CDP-diacylglycerol--glycerol-3-phosphate 3-phosphatidyltransferase